MSTLSETIKDIDNKKRHLEENVDSLTEECAQLKAQRKCRIFLLFMSCELRYIWDLIRKDGC